jgi:hypothetical protein
MAHLYVVPTCALCRGLKLRHSMAIYHLSASIVKRSAGRSVTAAAAYRAAVKIEDNTTGLTHDYTRKQGVNHSEIIVPVSIDRADDEWLIDREQLWNRVEQVEKRKDAQLAREITVAIPVELDRTSQIELVREYVRSNYVDRGMIADINLHHLDGKNPHAHVLLTMRNLQTSPEGEIEFGLKNTDWNNKELLIAQRQNWEEITNRYLAASGSDARIDCRSLEEQGSPFIPQIHVGVHAMAMKHKGIATDRGEEFDRIEAENNDIRARLEEIYQGESAPEPEPKSEDENHRIGELLYQNIKSYQPADSHSEPIYDFKLVNNRWVNQQKIHTDEYSLDNLSQIVKAQHDRFDRREVQRFELNDEQIQVLQREAFFRRLDIIHGQLPPIPLNIAPVIPDTKPDAPVSAITNDKEEDLSQNSYVSNLLVERAKVKAQEQQRLLEKNIEIKAEQSRVRKLRDRGGR